MPDVLSDGGYITGTYDITINAYPYTLNTIDHDKPVARADANTRLGTPKGGAYAKGKQSFSVQIFAIQDIPAPEQLVPFQLALHNEDTKWWIVTNLKITSANDGAAIRTYNADMVHHVNTPTS